MSTEHEQHALAPSPLWERAGVRGRTTATNDLDHEHDHAAAHPADHPAEPDHPLILDGAVVPGDVEIMVRCMIEELLQVGITPPELRQLSRDPNYQGLYAARMTLGDERIDALITRAAQRTGVHRFRTIEHTVDVQAVTLTVAQT